jgi:hypothetical protein
MSKAKMEAARELIREKRYDEARAILRTIDHPTARQWLGKIEQIDPTSRTAVAPPVVQPVVAPVPVAMGAVQEQDQYFARQNRRARRSRIIRGLSMILLGVLVIAAFLYLTQPIASLTRYPLANTYDTADMPYLWAMPALGIIGILVGLYLIIRRNA